jgi:hypothetical protein
MRLLCRAGAGSGPVPFRKEAVAVGDEKKQSGGILVKLIAGVFTAVIAPIAVAVGVKWLDPNAWKAAPPSGGPPAVAIPGPGQGESVIRLVGANLADHFYSYGFSAEQNSHVRNDKVDPKLFRHSAQGPQAGIQAPGGREGRLITLKEFDNYTLTLEYSWGNRDRSPGQRPARTAAVHVHATGIDKGTEQAYVVLLDEGNTGAVRLLGGPGKVQAVGKVKEVPLGNNRFCLAWDPKAQAHTLVTGTPAGWDGTLCRAGLPGPVPQPADGWNRVQVVCQGDTLRVIVNGQTTCELAGLSQKKGRLCLTSEQAEVHYRTMNIEPMVKK